MGINVSVGTPAQQRLVIFDTGSSVFGLFSKAPMQYTHKAIFGQKKAMSAVQQLSSAMGDAPDGCHSDARAARRFCCAPFATRAPGQHAQDEAEGGHAAFSAQEAFRKVSHSF